MACRPDCRVLELDFPWVSGLGRCFVACSRSDGLSAGMASDNPLALPDLLSTTGDAASMTFVPVVLIAETSRRPLVVRALTIF